MQVLDSSVLLTNFEVLQLIRRKYGLAEDPSRNLVVSPIDAQVMGYILDMLAGPENEDDLNRLEESIHRFLTRISPYNLTKAELMQILNRFPTTEVELHLIIDNLSDRCTPEQIQELMDLTMELAQTALSSKAEPQDNTRDAAAPQEDGAVEAEEDGMDAEEEQAEGDTAQEVHEEEEQMFVREDEAGHGDDENETGTGTADDEY